MKEDVDDLDDTHKDRPLRFENQFNDDFEKPVSFNFLSNFDGNTLLKAFEK